MIVALCYLVISYTYVMTMPAAESWAEAGVHAAAALCWPSGFVLWLMEH